VLIVDDAKSFVDVLKRRLSKRSLDVVTAQSGKEALAYLAENHNVDVVLLDIKMPEMSGLEVLKQIKVDFPLIEVILLSGHSSFESALEGMRLGAFDHLTKPCDIEELAAGIEQAKSKKMRVSEKIVGKKKAS